MTTLPETKACKVNIENEWLTISFNQPEKRNALTSELTDDIKNLLELHLSHRIAEDFKYTPKQNTSRDIWKYLASANLLEKVENIDLEDFEKINLIERKSCVQC